MKKVATKYVEAYFPKNCDKNVYPSNINLSSEMYKNQ